MKNLLGSPGGAAVGVAGRGGAPAVAAGFRFLLSKPRHVIRAQVP